MASFYALILLYPFISLGITKLLGNEGDLLGQFKEELRLFFGFTLAYIGVICLFLFGFDGVLDVVIAFIVYTILYFAVSIFRKTIYTGTTDDAMSA